MNSEGDCPEGGSHDWSSWRMVNGTLALTCRKCGTPK